MPTRETDPLRIATLPVANGAIGVTLCPGRQGDGPAGAASARDLSADVGAIRDWGAVAVVSILEPAEMLRLGVPGLGAAVAAAGMAWHPLAVPDLGVPDAAAEAAWRALSPALHRVLERGGRVLLHCRAGLGRSGTLAALLLTERGRNAAAAMAAVRAVRPGAIETPAQERWLAVRCPDADGLARRLRACLTGGAIGDSLGADIEFTTLPAIRHRFPHGIDALPPHDGLRGAITDDTQMTLFTAEGLIRAKVRGALRGICHPPSVVHHALLRWYRTQGRRPRVGTDDRGLIEDPRLHAQRAPGGTCLAALGAATRFGEPARNDSKGCGTIMRVAPVALMAPPDAVRALAVETSALTHGHRTGQLAAAAWAELLAGVAEGRPLEPAARALAAAYAALDGGDETAGALTAALAAPRDGRPETVESLGGGWTAETALAIALYACLAAADAEHGFGIAVTHSGDSDTTGAIAGTMLGLLHPGAVLAHPWAEVVECADRIGRLAADDAALSRDAAAAEHLADAYPGG